MQKLAGFNLQEADILRKAIGHKQADIMLEVEKDFLEGCNQIGLVDEKTAKIIFSGIKAAERYGFNKSHAVSYAYNGYLSAYCKAHFPRAFFTSYLTYAKEKQKPLVEVSELVRNAKMMNVCILPPDIRKLNPQFSLIDKIIYFGLCNVKSIGEGLISKITQTIEEVCKELGKDIDELTFMDYLLYIFPHNSIKVENLISVGAFDYLKLSRTYMVYMIKIFRDLKERELKWVSTNVQTEDIEELFVKILEAPTGKKGCCYTKKRLDKVRDLYKLTLKPPHKMNDIPTWVSAIELELLGISLSVSSVDSCDISSANCTCKEYLDGFNDKIVLIAGLIERVHEIATKKGKKPGSKMAFVNVSDISGALDTVIFPDQWEEAKGLCVEGNTIMVVGKRNKDSLIVSKILQI